MSKKGLGYRSRDEIICQILEIAYGGGATKSELFYKAFVNYGQLKEYLTVLTESDLLSYDLETQTFRLTKKGLTLLEAYSQIEQMLKKQQI
jgi:predicted transcriptional regulator